MNTVLLNIKDLNADNLIIALVGYVIVFSALVLLYFVFQNMPKLISWQTRIRLKRKGLYKPTAEGKAEEVLLPGGDNAAIAVALHLYFSEMHDEEKTVITIKKVSKTYSPWSSKIYNMNWPIR